MALVSEYYNQNDLLVSKSLHGQAQTDQNFPKNLRIDDLVFVEEQNSLKEFFRIVDVREAAQKLLPLDVERSEHMGESSRGLGGNRDDLGSLVRTEAANHRLDEECVLHRAVGNLLAEDLEDLLLEAVIHDELPLEVAFADGVQRVGRRLEVQRLAADLLQVGVGL